MMPLALSVLCWTLSVSVALLTIMGCAYLGALTRAKDAEVARWRGVGPS